MNDDLRKRAELAIKALPSSLQDDITEYWDSLATVRQRLQEQDKELERLNERWQEMDHPFDHSEYNSMFERAEAAEARVRALQDGLRDREKELLNHADASDEDGDHVGFARYYRAKADGIAEARALLASTEDSEP